MKLLDLRRLAVRRQIRIKYRLENGLTCLINEHGLAKIPELNTIPAFNLEEALAAVNEFEIEPAAGKELPRRLSRKELADWSAGSVPDDAPHEEE